MTKEPETREEVQDWIKETSLKWERRGSDYYSLSSYWEGLSRKESFGVPVSANHQEMIHHLYFGQKAFVTDEVKELVLTNIGSAEWLAYELKADKHFNSIMLSKWDEISNNRIPEDVVQAMRDSGMRGVSLSSKNCVLKAAGRILADPKTWSLEDSITDGR